MVLGRYGVKNEDSNTFTTLFLHIYSVMEYKKNGGYAKPRNGNTFTTEE